MMMFLSICIYSIFLTTTLASENPINHEGHLKPFGTGKSVKVVDFTGFPSSRLFFTEYVSKKVPLVMRGAAKNFPATKLWDDSYFLSLNLGDQQSSYVSVETKKKEDRLQETDYLHFHQFVKLYNRTEHYMVQAVPQFLKNDVLVPGPLQCTSFINQIVDTLMWFSSGGTKSVVHTDGVDNINCLIRGKKKFVIVNPSKYGKFVPLDQANGTYSSLDVDSVDFNKYPSMAKVDEYFTAEMEAGDCLYIPYQWIHQVRSYERNIAINFWWDSTRFNPTGDFKWERECTKTFDDSWTCAKIDTIGIGVLEFISQLKNIIHSSKVYLEPESFITSLNPEADELEKEIGVGFKMQLNQIFLIADKDKDLLVTTDDIPLWTIEDMKRMNLYYRRYERILMAFEDHMRRQEEAEAERERENQQELPPEYRGLKEEL